MRLHHCSKRITKGSLDLVIALLKEMKVDLLERSKDGEAAWLSQDNGFVLQFVESEQEPLATDVKRNSHIGFLSHDPRGDLGKLKRWLMSRKIRVTDGSWTRREFYFDCPDIFVDFVIEIMHTSVIQ